MELRNLATGGVFECGDEQGNRLLSEGGYEKVGAAPQETHAAPVKRVPRKAVGGTH